MSASSAIGKFARRAAEELHHHSRELERSSQEVLEVIFNGPYKSSSPVVWETKKRQAARTSVQQAIDRFRQIQ